MRESLLLEHAERAARALSPKQHATMRKYYDAAIRRREVAGDLADERGMVSALVLYRDVLQLLLAAVIISRRGDADVASLQTPAAWQQLSDLIQEGRVESPPLVLQQARELLAQHDLLALDSCSSAELAGQRASIEAACRWLETLVEPRTPREIRISRSLHVGIIAAVVIGALVWSVVVLLTQPNLALHKPVTISKRLPQSVAPADNSGLVNGEIEAGYGIHTTMGGAWIMVDLMKPTRISKVSVYNRSDGWLDDGLPLVLAFSDDAAHFVEVGRRTTGFTSKDPWTFDAGGRQARYVRIQSDKYIALTELEVYGSQ